LTLPLKFVPISQASYTTTYGETPTQPPDNLTR
ncbi:hypothetical protein AZE42_04145, partial [Rhizopogon vesiculosus]